MTKAAHKRAKYKNLNSAFSKKKTSKEETVILDDTSDGKSSSSSEDNNWLNGCRDAFIIDKLKPNSKSKIKENKLSSNNLDKVWHDARLLNTKTEKSFSFPELHANKVINQSLHVVDLNIDHYDIIIGRDLIRSLGIDIYGVDMTIQWNDSTILWRNIDSTKKDVFFLLQYNAPFNSETRIMKHILDDKYTKADIKTIA